MPKHVFTADEENRLGVRCGGCGRRITSGWEWHIAELGMGRDRTPERQVAVAKTCNDKKCPAYKSCAEAASFRRRISIEWLIGEPESSTPPPGPVILRR